MKSFYTLFSTLLISVVVNAQDCEVKNKCFTYGEEVNYTIYYYLMGMWVSAGEVNFKVDSARIDGELLYHFDSYGSTYKKYDWIYEVRDHFESFVDAKTMAPLKFKRKVNEGSTYIREDYTFRSDQNDVITLRQLEEDEPMVKDTVAMNGCSYDVMTMIYYARNIDYSQLKEGEKVPIKIFLDNEAHDSFIRYLGKKELEVRDVGTFNCIVFSPLLIEGTIFNEGEDMTVWVTDDANRVPLLIETPILVGSIKARINKMKGLRHDLESKIN